MVHVMLVTGHLTQHACDYTRYTRAVITSPPYSINNDLREDVSIHRTNLKYYGKSPKIRFLSYFYIL